MRVGTETCVFRSAYRYRMSVTYRVSNICGRSRLLTFGCRNVSSSRRDVEIRCCFNSRMGCATYDVFERASSLFLRLFCSNKSFELWHFQNFDRTIFDVNAPFSEQSKHKIGRALITVRVFCNNQHETVKKK